MTLHRTFVAFVTLALPLAACRAPFYPEDPTGGNTPPVTSGPLLPLRIGSLGADFARAVTTDASGNAYVAGYFANTVDFDGSGGATARIASGPYDISVAKYSPSGDFQWVFTIGGTGADVPFNIVRASDGGLYIAGYITAGAVCNGRALPNAGGHDILLLRVSPTGTCDWAVTVGGSGDDEAHDLAVDANGDILLAGVFADTVDFDPGSGLAQLVSRGGQDGFLARYASDGTFRNVIQIGGVFDDAINAVALRSDGDIMIGGDFGGTATFGSSLAPQLLVSAGAFDFFLARLAPSLGLEWAIRGGGTGNDMIGTGGIITSSNGITYVAGTFTGTASVSPSASQLLTSHGDVDVFIASYDGTGAWAGLESSFGGTGTEDVSAFTRDAAGNFYLGGAFQGLVDFDPGAGTHNVQGLGSAGAGDAYILSLTSTGDLRWITPLGAGIAGDANYAITGGLALAGDGTLWAVGRFFGSVDFDPGVDAVQRASVGDADQFIARYQQATGAIVQ